MGFGGDVVSPKGQITLSVTLRDGNMSRTEEVTFVVVVRPSNYNVIFGRSTLLAFGAMVSTAHAMLKFPTLSRVATLLSDASVCNLVATVDEENLPSPWRINDYYPDQTIQVGPDIVGKVRERLYSLLRNNSEVFAWSPDDMTGVPRQIAEHRLNVSPNMKPVAQKKRHLARERSEAACKEVQKLVQAHILREVKYHSWIANPVLVKKSDGSWRMCIDFKKYKQGMSEGQLPTPGYRRQGRRTVQIHVQVFPRRVQRLSSNSNGRGR